MKRLLACLGSISQSPLNQDVAKENFLYGYSLDI